MLMGKYAPPVVSPPLPRGVLLIGPSPPPSGGIAAHLVSMADKLSSVEYSIPVRLVKPSKYAIPRLVRELARAHRMGWVVHLHVCGHNRSSFLLGALVAHFATRAPTILTVHSGLAPQYLASLNAIDRMLVRQVGAGFGRVVAVNGRIKEELNKVMGVARGSSPLLIPAWVNVDQSREVVVPEVVYQARGHHRWLLCAHIGAGVEYGASDLLHGFATLVKQAAQSGNDDDGGGPGLVVIGSGSMDEDTVGLCQSLGVGERCYMLGDLDREQALAVMGLCDLFVRPSLADGDSGSVREALAIGLTVVATDVTPRPAGVILCPPANPVQMAETIKQVLARIESSCSVEHGLERLKRAAEEMLQREFFPLLQLYTSISIEYFQSHI